MVPEIVRGSSLFLSHRRNTVAHILTADCLLIETPSPDVSKNFQKKSPAPRTHESPKSQKKSDSDTFPGLLRTCFGTHHTRRVFSEAPTQRPRPSSPPHVPFVLRGFLSDRPPAGSMAAPVVSSSCASFRSAAPIIVKPDALRALRGRRAAASSSAARCKQRGASMPAVAPKRTCAAPRSIDRGGAPRDDRTRRLSKDSCHDDGMGGRRKLAADGSRA